MEIHEYYYNDNNRRLYVEFSTKQDGDKFYRNIDLGFEDVELYSPEVITEEDMLDIDEDFVIELLNQYFIDNDLPEEIIL